MKETQRSLNYEILLVIAFTFFTVYIRKKEIIISFENVMANYFSNDRISNLIEFFSVTIGIYMTLISIFAISVTKIMIALSERDMEDKFLSVLMSGLISCIVVVLYIVFMPIIAGYYLYFIFLLILAIFHFIYFICILYNIFKFNVKNMPKEVREEDKFKKGIASNIFIIKDDIEEIRKELKQKRK